MSNYTKGTNFTAKDSLVTGNPSKLVKGSEIDAELNAVAAAIATKEDTTSTDTKLAFKASLSGATYTGTHNFTGATVTATTQATSDDSTKVATTEFVNNVAMNTALPSQTGNSGKFVTTDGTNASWDSPFPSQTGNSGKILTTNGTSTAWTNSSFVLLTTLTPTAAANVEALSVFTSSYDNYLIFFEGIRPAADDALRMRFAVAGSVDTGSNYSEGTSSTNLVSASSSSVTGTVATAGKGCGGSILIVNTNDATLLKPYSAQTVHQVASGGTIAGRLMIGTYTAANAISGVQFFWSAAANFAATGKIRIYGYNNT